MSDALAGRVVAVAGAAGGAGPSVCAALSRDGAAVALCGRDGERLEAVAAGLGAGAGRVDVHPADLGDERATRAWAGHLRERFGRVDALVHLVGGWRGGTPLEQAPLEDWDALHEALVRTVQHTTRAFSPLLREAGATGRFVLVSSPQAQAPTHDTAAYAAAKAAAEAWTLALADGLAGTGATANVVVVKAIATPAMLERKGADAFPTFTRATALADTIAYLCTTAAGGMNGQRVELRGSGVGG